MAIQDSQDAMLLHPGCLTNSEGFSSLRILFLSAYEEQSKRSWASMGSNYRVKYVDHVIGNAHALCDKRFQSLNILETVTMGDEYGLGGWINGSLLHVITQSLNGFLPAPHFIHGD